MNGMFKSLQWKIIIMFVLLVLSVMIIAGTVLITQVGEFYSERFSNSMTLVFGEEDITREIETAAQSDNTVANIMGILYFYSSALRIEIN